MTLEEHIDLIEEESSTYEEAVNHLYFEYSDSYRTYYELFKLVRNETPQQLKIAEIIPRNQFSFTKAGFNSLKKVYLEHNDEFNEFEKEIIALIGKKDYSLLCQEVAIIKIKRLMERCFGTDEEDPQDNANILDEQRDDETTREEQIKRMS